MDFTARDGTGWCAYIEAVPGTDRGRSLLPARRLRFDSALESRAVSPVPAGAPFFSDSRLRALLDRSLPVVSFAGEPARGDGWQQARRIAERTAALAGRVGARMEEVAAAAADRAMAWAASLLARRPGARP
jgi:hypothetical protein